MKEIIQELKCPLCGKKMHHADKKITPEDDSVEYWCTNKKCEDGKEKNGYVITFTRIN